MRCDYLTSRPDILGYDDLARPEGAPMSLECCRERDHLGSHLVRRHDGTYIQWFKEICPPTEECASCENEDPEDDCLVYGAVDSIIELERLLKNPQYEGSQ